MSYETIGWQNEPSTATALSAENFGHMDQGIYDAHQGLNELQGLAYSPLKAATVADMTDQTRVYVYTGSETGYVSGNWYYYNGSSWVSGGVYNAVAVSTDKTLSISDKAADAKATGDKITFIKNEVGNFLWSKTAVSRFIDIPVPVNIGETLYVKPIEWTGETVTYFTLAGIKNGQLQPTITVITRGFDLYYTATDDYDGIRVSAATSAAPSTTETLAVIAVNISAQNAMSEIALKNKEDLRDYIPYAKYEGTFTAKQQKSTGIGLLANTTYIIKCESKLTERVNVYSSADTTNYKSLSPWHNTVRLTTGNSVGVLYFYNPASNLDALNITVYVEGNYLPKINRVPKVYVVDKSNSQFADFSSFTDCLLALKDDDSPKIIYINGGDYDIHAEYVAANVPIYSGNDPSTNYWDYNVWIPNNTHIIGRGIVRLMWMPNSGDVTPAQSKTVSPVNVAGSMTLENVEIHCKNGRYCIHDDPNGQMQFTNAIKKYINVKCFKYANDDGYGFAPAIGFGLDNSMYYEFDNCLLKNLGNERAFYVHTRGVVGGYALSEKQSSNIVLNNCVLDSGSYSTIAKLGNISNNSNLHVRVNFNNCSFNNNTRCFVQAINESGTTPVNANAFDITMNRCSENVEVYIADTNNQYPPSIVH